MPQLDMFDQEVRICLVKEMSNLFQNLSATLEAINKKIFPNIYVVLKIVTIIPVTTAVTLRWNMSRQLYVAPWDKKDLILFIHKDISLRRYHKYICV